MLKIGFIDNFLSEWHANNYPDMIRKSERARALGLDVCFAYAKTEVSPYDGVSTDEWCRKYKVHRLNTVEELVAQSDCIVVLAPDHPGLHFELAEAALKSGKPVYIDKTFAAGKAEAERLFALAKAHGTPLWSSSALRFAAEIETFRLSERGAKSCVVTGPYLFDIYAIHIFEIMCTVMKSGAKRMMSVLNGLNRAIAVDYGDGRLALFNQNETGEAPFSVSVEAADGKGKYCPVSDGYFERFIDALVGFFGDGKPPVDSRETVDLMSMLTAAKAALEKPFEWVEI